MHLFYHFSKIFENFSKIHFEKMMKKIHLFSKIFQKIASFSRKICYFLIALFLIKSILHILFLQFCMLNFDKSNEIHLYLTYYLFLYFVIFQNSRRTLFKSFFFCQSFKAFSIYISLKQSVIVTIEDTIEYMES